MLVLVRVTIIVNKNAQLEAINITIEGKVLDRTSQLNKKTEELAHQNAQLEAINANIEQKVLERTAELDKKTNACRSSCIGQVSE